MGLARPARLGIVFDDARVARWQLDMLVELQQSSLCEVFPSVLGGARVRPRRRLFGAYERMDRRHFETPEDSLAETEIAVPAGAELPDELDAVIWLADRPAPSRLSRDTPVWYIAQGGARSLAEKPLAEELRSGSGAVLTELRCVDSRGDRQLLGSIGVTDRLSLHRGRTRAYARAARLPLRHLRRVAQGLYDLDEGLTDESFRRSKPRLFGTRVLFRLALRIGASKARGLLFREQWLVGYRRPGAEEFATLVPPRGEQYADPFPVEAGDESLLFFERFGQTGDGKIAMAPIGDHGHGEPETVLETDTHLSYPFPVHRGGEVLLMPESRRLRRVELWRATGFPRGWEPERVLLPHLPATDATLFERDGRFWLFTALAVDEGPAVDELHLFSASSLEDEWQPHPLNPVVADVHRARPAGPLYVHDGELVRPAQDCSQAYGWRVVLNRVTVLTEDDYRDEPMATLSPAGAGLTQLHTYSVTDGWEAIDVLRRSVRGPLSRRAPASVRMRQTTAAPGLAPPR